MRAFENKVAVITGGAHGIGRAITDAFLREGAVVHIIDTQPGDWFVGDVSDPSVLERFAASIIKQSGHVDFLINNAKPPMHGIDSCTWEEFSHALAVGVTAPFYLTKLLMPYFAPGAFAFNCFIFSLTFTPNLCSSSTINNPKSLNTTSLLTIL